MISHHHQDAGTEAAQPTTPKGTTNRFLLAFLVVSVIFNLIMLLSWSSTRHGGSSFSHGRESFHSSSSNPIIYKQCPYLGDYDNFVANKFQSKDKSEMWNILQFIVSQEAMNDYLRNSENRDIINFGVPHLVTATSHDYFDRLENFVGSVHRLYENKVNALQINPQVTSPPGHPNDEKITKIGQTFKSHLRSNYWLVWNSVVTPENRPILVYDLGLTKEQREKVYSWKNVQLISLNFDLLPKHFRDLKTFAWKPLVMYLALQKFPSIIFLDSGVELWNRLDRIEDILFTKGYFHVVQEGLTTAWRCCGAIGELTHQSTFNYLGLKREEYGQKEMCSGGIQGYIRDSYSYQNVLIPTLECAWDVNCIAPPGSSLANHRQDQSVFSLMIHKAGITCEKDIRLWGNRGNYVDVPQHEIVLFLRKGAEGKQYIGQAQKKKKFAVVIPFAEKQVSSVLENINIWNHPYYEPCQWSMSTRENIDDSETDLIFYSNRQRNENNEKAILDRINNLTKDKSHNVILKCFSNISFKYAGLNDARDQYPAGPSNQFYDLIHDENFHSTYSHFFYMEPDCRAIRPNWLKVVKSILKEYSILKPDFWYIGSNYRGDVDLGEPLEYRYHINGNAIYSTDVSFRAFLKHVSRGHNFAYDTDPFKYLFQVKSYDFTKHIWNRIIFHNFVQNWWHSSYHEKTVRDLYPRTYFVHGGSKE
ncbi:hypothetical protein FDP41_008049 [Naegleria fowleri]|uniref:Nucleotide-diphospho-sugar transferase domain-containing protein n=1 Tax=Naegleria fowleri TaxID=5763 RepID=A0A6A5CC45_NAEFO|nr:uncharacterized protein FDP41_008049 [Naegleria fowleri]KAF0984134.1 hypothetical protein FDP41_008049 [Naegleria fowleri]